MWGKNIAVGALAGAALIIATDARSWLVGKILDRFEPSGGAGLAILAHLPWGSIIGVPVFVCAAVWLIWDAVGRASFRARFGTERALRAYIRPLEDEIRDAHGQIRCLFSALAAFEDRDLMRESAEKQTSLAELIEKLAHDSGKLQDSQAMLLVSFVGEWSDELEYWGNVARRYDPRSVNAIVHTPHASLEQNHDAAANIADTDAIAEYLRFQGRYQAWLETRDAIDEKVHKATVEGQTLFKPMPVLNA